MKTSNDNAMGGIKTIEASEFKAKGLKLLDEIAETGGDIIITKKGIRFQGSGRIGKNQRRFGALTAENLRYSVTSLSRLTWNGKPKPTNLGAMPSDSTRQRMSCCGSDWAIRDGDIFTTKS